MENHQNYYDDHFQVILKIILMYKTLQLNIKVNSGGKK